MAKIYRKQGRWREAIAGLEHAQSLNPRAEAAELVHTLWMVRDWPGAAAVIKGNLAQTQYVPYSRIGLAQIEVVAKCNLSGARLTERNSRRRGSRWRSNSGQLGSKYAGT
jgi:hypothetical protein